MVDQLLQLPLWQLILPGMVVCFVLGVVANRWTARTLKAAFEIFPRLFRNSKSD